MKLSRRWLLPLLILWLAFGLRLYHLDFQSIWWDEGHSLFVASHPIPQIPTLPAMDVHPPAYFTLLHLWLNLTGQSEFSLRYLSVIFSLLTVALIWRFAVSISRSFASPLLASLFTAISPLYVAYAQEVRSYSMITFLALASTYLLWRILFTAGFAGRRLPGGNRQSAVSVPQGEARRSRRSAVALYILLTAACLYTHYFTIFLLLFHNLAWLVWSLLPGRVGDQIRAGQLSRISRLVTWLTSQLGILLLFTPQLLLALRQVTSYTNPNLAPPSPSEFISRSWQAYTVGLTIDPVPANWGMAAIAGVFIIVIAYQFTIYDIVPFGYLRFTIYDIVPFGYLRNTQHATRNTFSSETPRGAVPSLTPDFLFLLAWFVIPLVAYFIVLQRQPSFEPRYMILVTPALFLLLALGLVNIQPSTHLANLQLFRQSLKTKPSTLHASRFTLHASRFTPHASRFTLHASRFTLYALSAIPFIVFAAGLSNYYTNESYFKDDSAGVAAWLAAETTAKDVVFVDVPHPFHYYVAKGHIAAPTRYLFVDIHTAAATLTREAAGRDRLFWITWRGSDTDPRGVIPFLAQKYGQLLGQRQFRGYEVEWFSLPGGDTIFSLPTDLNPVNATFGDVLRLDGAAYGGFPPSGDTTFISHPAWAALHFTLLRDTEVDYKVSLRLRGEAGSVVSQADKDLLNDRHFRTSAWPLQDPALNQALNVYTLSLAPDTSPGSYRLEVVVYNARPPYPSEGVTGLKSMDGTAAVIGSITVIP